MREWINNRFNTNFTDDDLSSIKDFSLIWNVFENVVCQNRFNLQSIENGIINHQMNADNFNAHLQYFKQRYVTNGILNPRFPYLNFRQNDRRPLIEDVLLGVNTNNNDIILALIIIVYRYRNNLFHGLKNMQKIDQQKDNFDNANNVLKIFLNYY